MNLAVVQCQLQNWANSGDKMFKHEIKNYSRNHFMGSFLWKISHVGFQVKDVVLVSLPGRAGRVTPED